MVTISGTAANVPTTQQMWVSDGTSSLQGPAGPWSMQAIAGPGTLIGMRLNAGRPEGLLLQHVTFAAGSTFNLDFAGQFFPSESDLTLDPTGGSLFMTTTYVDETGGQHRIDIASSAVTKYRVMPADRIGGGISLLYESASSGSASRSIQRAFKAPVAQTLILPPAFLLPSPPVMSGAAAYPIVTATVPRRTGASYYELNYLTSSIANKFHIWDVIYSAGWVDAAPGADLVSRLPDLTSVPGWSANFALTPSGTRQWTASVATGPVRLQPGAARYGVQGRTMTDYQEGDENTASSTSGQFP
jgi:hypothetical protein